MFPYDEGGKEGADPSNESGVRNGCAKENDLRKKLTSMLSGIPPPPSLGTCRMSCSQLLERCQLNKHLLELHVCSSPASEANPKVFYENRGEVSEEIAELMLKVQARFVQLETATSFTWTESERPMTNSARKRRQWNGISPGRRLSHLARRRQMFSKANLQLMSQNESKNHRLAIKTTVPTQRNLAKEYMEYKAAASKEKNLPKRALFQSPEEAQERPGFRTVARQVPRRRLFDNTNNRPALELPPGGGSYDVSGWLASQSFAGGRKRGREETRDSDRKRRCPRRSLDFSDGSPSRSSGLSTRSSNTPTVSSTMVAPALTLTHLHKQKLLWAVAVTLKEKNITHRDAQFKVCASTLFSVCKKNLAAIQALQIAGGTSDKMLTYAKGQVDAVIAKIRVVSDVSQSAQNITSSPQSGILLDVSESTLNQKPTETCEHTSEGKENIQTPKRKMIARVWRSCLKSVKKSKLRLCRSHSCDDLEKESVSDSVKLESACAAVKPFTYIPTQENVGCKRKRCLESSLETSENLDAVSTAERVETTCFTEQFTENSEPQNKECCIATVTPEKEKDNSGCIPASQEHISMTSVFPALSKKSMVPTEPAFFERSPDIFESFESSPKGAREGFLLEESIVPQERGECNELTVSANGSSDDAYPPPKCSFDSDPLMFTIPADEYSKELTEVQEVSVANGESSEISQLFGNSLYLEKVPFVIPIDEYSGELTEDQEVSVDNGVSSEISQVYDNYVDVDADPVEPEYRLVEVVAVVDDSNLVVDEKEISSPECSDEECEDEPHTQVADHRELAHLAVDSCEISTVNDGSTLSVTEDTVDDGTYINESSLEMEAAKLCTSTPLEPLSKVLIMKSRPAWRVEPGPGLKVRVRLSKDWDIVGRESPKSSNNESEDLQSSKDVSELSEGGGVATELNVGCEQMNDSDNNVMVAPQKTELSVKRLTSVDSSGTSMESYTLMEIKDRLAIERTLEADSSDATSFNFGSSSSSTSVQRETSAESGSPKRTVIKTESDADYSEPSDTAVNLFTDNTIKTIIEISPEVAIQCYKKSPSNEKQSDDEEIDFDVEEKIALPEQIGVCLSSPTSLTDDDDETPLIQLISESSRASFTKNPVSPEENDSSDDELPLIQLIDGSSSRKLMSPKQNEVFSFCLVTDDEEEDDNRLNEDDLPLSHLVSLNENTYEEDKNLDYSKVDKTEIGIDFGSRTGNDRSLQDYLKLESEEDESSDNEDLPLSQLSKSCTEGYRLSHQGGGEQVTGLFSEIVLSEGFTNEPKTGHFNEDANENISGMTRNNGGESLLPHNGDCVGEVVAAEYPQSFQLGLITEANGKSLSTRFDELLPDISSEKLAKAMTDSTRKESVNENFGKAEWADDSTQLSYYKLSRSIQFDEVLAENYSKTPPKKVNEIKEEPTTENLNENVCGKTEAVDNRSQVIYKSSLSVQSDELFPENCSKMLPKVEVLKEEPAAESLNESICGKTEEIDKCSHISIKSSLSARFDELLAEKCSETSPRKLTATKEEESGSDRSVGRSKQKLTLECYKARKRLDLASSQPENEVLENGCAQQIEAEQEITYPKKIYNIRLKKKERKHRTKHIDRHRQSTDSEESHRTKHSHRPSTDSEKSHRTKHSHRLYTDSEESHRTKHSHRLYTDSEESHRTKHSHRLYTDSEESHRTKHSHRQSTDSVETYSIKHSRHHRISADSDELYLTKHLSNHRRSTDSDESYSYRTKQIYSHRPSASSDESSKTSRSYSRRQSIESSSSSTHQTVVEENVKKIVCENTKTVLQAMSTLSEVVQKEMLLAIPGIVDSEECMRKLKRLTQVSTISKQLLENLMAITPSSVRGMT